MLNIDLHPSQSSVILVTFFQSLFYRPGNFPYCSVYIWTLLKAFITYVRPKLEYNSPVWNPYLKKDNWNQQWRIKRGAERAEARGPTTFRGPTNLHFSKFFFLTKNIFEF